MPRGGVPGESRVSLNSRSSVGFSTFNAWEDTAFPPTKKERGKERSRSVDSTQFVLLLLKLFRLQCSFLSLPFFFLPGFPHKLA